MSQTTSSKLVSILINNYNYGHFLKDAIDSALAQTYLNCEVIVVDDGSTDSSPEIIAGYGDRIIPLLKENGGQASAFNQGLEKSRGDIICFLDADDTFAINKAQRLIDIFSRYPDARWCFHPIERVDSQLETIPWDESDWGHGGMYNLQPLLKKGKLGKAAPFDCLVTSGMSFRQDLLSNFLPMPLEISITSDDYIKYAAMGTNPGYMLMEKLACQRLHGKNAYTGQHENKILQGKVLLQTAYFLKKDFPAISAFADNLYALGLSKLAGHSLDTLDLEALDQAYARSLSLGDALKVRVKKTYYQIRAK